MIATQYAPATGRYRTAAAPTISRRARPSPRAANRAADDAENADESAREREDTGLPQGPNVAKADEPFAGAEAALLERGGSRTFGRRGGRCLVAIGGFRSGHA